MNRFNNTIWMAVVTPTDRISLSAIVVKSTFLMVFCGCHFCLFSVVIRGFVI